MKENPGKFENKSSIISSFKNYCIYININIYRNVKQIGTRQINRDRQEKIIISIIIVLLIIEMNSKFDYMFTMTPDWIPSGQMLLWPRVHR